MHCEASKTSTSSSASPKGRVRRRSLDCPLPFTPPLPERYLRSVQFIGMRLCPCMCTDSATDFYIFGTAQFPQRETTKLFKSWSHPVQVFLQIVNFMDLDL